MRTKQILFLLLVAVVLLTLSSMAEADPLDAYHVRAYNVETKQFDTVATAKSKVSREDAQFWCEYIVEALQARAPKGEFYCTTATANLIHELRAQ